MAIDQLTFPILMLVFGRLLSPEEIKEYCGLIRTDDLIGGLWVPGKVPAFPQYLLQS
jgi:glycine/D-amino acid oxidase-like deaminating enzyme